MHGENDLKFCMLMYHSHLQNWMDCDHGLLIFLVLVLFWISETGQIGRFRAFPEEHMDGMTWNCVCWCTMPSFRTGAILTNLRFPNILRRSLDHQGVLAFQNTGLLGYLVCLFKKSLDNFNIVKPSKYIQKHDEYWVTFPCACHCVLYKNDMYYISDIQIIAINFLYVQTRHRRNAL